MIVDLILDSLRNAVLIAGLVVVMMMLIETLNINSRGGLFAALRKSKAGQVVVSALLGLIPGCMGGFAAVSLYTHGIVSFGALVAMMIASSGDEAFVMLAMFPKDALWLFLILFAVAVAVGIVTALLYKPKRPERLCEAEFSIHEEDEAPHRHAHGEGRHVTWQRVIMFTGTALFIAALVTGSLEHGEDGPEAVAMAGGINLLSEECMYWLFGALSLIVLAVLVFGKDHFVEEHLWHHIIVRHLPSVFLWSFGVLLLVGVLMNYLDLSAWIGSNTALMILLATLVGIIPESGPHLIFVTLYASGVIPFPVLLASCISQDGHASLPLLAESKRGFLRAKLLNCAVALAAGFAAMLL